MALLRDTSPKKHIPQPGQFTPRLLLLLGFTTVICLLIIMRLVFLQGIKGATYRAYADRIYGGTNVHISSSERGDIVMVNKQGIRYMLAGQKVQYFIVIDPAKVVSSDTAFKSLNSLLPTISRSEFDGYIASNKKHTFSTFPLDKEYIIQVLGNRESVSGIVTPGIQIISEKVRHYPGGRLASHVLGFVGYNGDELEGRYGLEKEYDELLKVQDKNLYTNFFVELFSTLKSFSIEPEQLSGQATLVTTLEPEIQNRSEQLLDIINEKFSPREAGIIILDSKTGAVLSMARTPFFDVNEFSSIGNVDTYTNSSIQKVYEVGSIMKPLVMAYALEEGKITLDTEYNDKGSIEVADRTIYNYDKRARGRVNMREVIIQSLNTGMVFVMEKLNRRDVRHYFELLGLRDKTGIDLPYETKGLTSNLDSLRAVEYANIAFGQGIAVTPIAMLRALNILANNGSLVNPHVVDKIEYPYGSTKDLGAIANEHQKKILSDETVSQIADVMVELVDRNFKNDPNHLQHYSVAAKTGTAQIASANVGYEEGRRLHTFFGFFPAHNPRFSVYLYAVQPQGVKYSAETLSGPFMDLAQFLINYYNIPPDRGISSS